MDALEKEIALRQDYLGKKPVQTVYFGGGTPSLLSVSELENILRLLGERFDLSQVVEMTLEANPEFLLLRAHAGGELHPLQTD